MTARLSNMDSVRDWFVLWGRLLADTGRVLRDHWPQLVGLCLLGIIGRMGFLWLALWGSNFHGAVGVLILPFAPLSTLISLMLMLRVTSETLPAFQGTYRGSTVLERWYYHFMITARVLVPFIAAYASQGLLAQDSRYYVQDVYYDVSTSSIVTSVAPRLDYAEGWYLLLLVVVTLVLRKAISITDVFRRSTVAALGAMYLESLWVVTLAKAFLSKFKEILQWIRERAVIDNLAKAWEAFSAWLGPVGDAVRAAVEWVAGLGGGFSTLVVIPLAWLAIGAANYQADLASSEMPTPKGVAMRLGKLSERSRRVLAEIAEPVITPLRHFWGALSRIIVAGPAPIVIFCLSFVVVNQSQVGAAWLLHEAIGPRSPTLHLALFPYLDAASQLVGSVLGMALLAAAVNLVVGGKRLSGASRGEAGNGAAVPKRGLERDVQVFRVMPPQA